MTDITTTEKKRGRPCIYTPEEAKERERERQRELRKDPAFVERRRERLRQYRAKKKAEQGEKK